jgi:glutamate dehydrogenase/leucine dehydrogenase
LPGALGGKGVIVQGLGNVGYYVGMRMVWQGRSDIADLRVAAYIVSVSRVASTQSVSTLT